MGRLHTHLGRTVVDSRGGRVEGIRNRSETGVIFDGSGCIQRGVKFYNSRNDVILTEGLYGILPEDLVTKVISIRNGRVLYARVEGWLAQQSEGSSNKGGV